MKEIDFKVTVPATTANLGPGFDCLGLALQLYMVVNVSSSDAWKVTYEEEEFQQLPTGENNLIVTTILEIAELYGKGAPTLELTVTSDIPLGKGLGSSASAIAAGLEIANHLFRLELSMQEKITIGSRLEGHADNIAAALHGGFIVSYYENNEVHFIQLPEPKIGVVVLVPPHVLSTEASRGLLPEKIDHSIATLGNAASSLMIAAITQNDWETAGCMMESDLYHEPYRKHLYHEFDQIRENCHALGAYGMTVSGAGPSLLIAVKQGDEERIVTALGEQFPNYKGIATGISAYGAKIN